MATKNDDAGHEPIGERGGRVRERGVPFDPSAASFEAAVAPAVRLPRPTRHRYPIPPDLFQRLKDQAGSREAPRLDLRATTVAADGTRQTQEVAAGDGMVAFAPAAAPAAAPTAVASFEGIPFNGSFPFDATMAAGPNHVLLSVNTRVAVYAKTGGAALLNRTLDSWFANVLTGAMIFDPKALYDQHAGRWVVLAVAFRNAPNRAWFLLSVSQGADPLGPWWNYALDAGVDNTTKTSNWADYPNLGVDNQALYLTANMFPFDPNGSFQYVKIRVVPKVGPYSGGAVTFRDITGLKHADGELAFTLQPCHTFGAPGEQYFATSEYPTSDTGTQSTITLWVLTNPTGTPALVRRTVTTDPFGIPPSAKQKGAGPPLDSGDIRLMNAVFRGGSVWTSLTTRHDWGDGVPAASSHWFQINPGTGQLVQQGVYGARGRHYIYPAVMPDNNGNMIMVVCRCGATEFASIRFTGRRSTDALGKLQTSALLKAGTATHSAVDDSGRNRWGDYSGIAVDPNDGRTIWFYSGFAAQPTSEWRTWVGCSRF
jgi:hypothetical protein